MGMSHDSPTIRGPAQLSDRNRRWLSAALTVQAQRMEFASASKTLPSTMRPSVVRRSSPLMFPFRRTLPVVLAVLASGFIAPSAGAFEPLEVNWLGGAPVTAPTGV